MTTKHSKLPTSSNFKIPVVHKHAGIFVVRDDLFPGGTKARVLHPLFRGVEGVVYATPAQGGAQTALALVGKRLKRRVVLFVARRGVLHPRTALAQSLGAEIKQVDFGMLNVIQARAREYAGKHGGIKLMPFGGSDPEVNRLLQNIALMVSRGVGPVDEIWCASGSGTLARALAFAFSASEIHAVQVGHKLTPEEVSWAKIHVYPRPFSYAHKQQPPFPADPHYEAKAWELCIAHKRPKGNTVLFWNTTGPA